MTGVCARCTGELDGAALSFALEIGPGLRAGSAVSTVTTRAEFALCPACWPQIGWAIDRAVPVPVRRSTRCVVQCRGHRQGAVHMVAGAASDAARCPNCHGRAEVEVTAGVIVPHVRRWRRWLIGRLAA